MARDPLDLFIDSIDLSEPVRSSVQFPFERKPKQDSKTFNELDWREILQLNEDRGDLALDEQYRAYAPNFDPLEYYDRSPLTTAQDIVSMTDARPAMHAKFMGTLEQAPVYDPPAQPAAIGMMTGTGLALQHLTPMAGKQAIKNLPVVTDRSTRFASGGLVGLNPEIGMTAYHGSPHRFDKFSMENIGTGEGGQAYGYGLYFAENLDVANSYVSKIAPDRFRGMDIGSELMFMQNKMDAMPTSSTQFRQLQERYQVLEDVGSAKSAKDIKNKYSDPDEYLPETIDLAASIKGSEASTHTLYEVDIPDNHVKSFLDWDAPLSGQGESVRKNLEKALLDDGWKNYLDAVKKHDSGDTNALRDAGYNMFDYPSAVGGIYQTIASEMGEKGASEFLNKAGIKGIKYYDQGSRAGSEGTRNLVVFDEDIVNVKSRR